MELTHQALSLAHLNGVIGAPDSNTTIIAVVVVAVVLVLAFIIVKAMQKPAPRDDHKATPPGDTHKPTKDLLEERLEVEGPVEITEGMSLAEIKRAKSARIKGEKGKRETAVEATEKSRAEHQEVEASEGDGLDDVSAGWDDMLDERSGAEADDAVEAAAEPATKPKPAPAEEHAKSLQDGLAKTRKGFISRLGELFKGDKLDEEIVDEVEEVLFTADIGPKAARDIMQALEDHLESHEKENPAVVWSFVRTYVEGILQKREEPIDLSAHHPFVILVVGVNGVGKTTTIGKLASQYKREGKKVLMVAGDTFRAAAVEQLGVWGERTDIPVHQGESDADPASVIYSGIERGVNEGADVIICDTAGRLHTKANLLDELKKIGRVASKVIDTAPHETILVLDANTGQNAIQQAKLFQEAVDITGIVLTKLDGTAKGGVILGICEELDAPIRYIGIGEGVADLRRFDSSEFVEALFM